jgi:N-methylhydantoinase B/oxoprolinase/acetone carboxylase alpha subunit
MAARRTVAVLDGVELQVLSGALRACCREMGVVLIRSAHSSNIKERRDASTGLFDADGQMVMQAEHIPVHLGAMPAAVESVLGERHEPDVPGSSTTRSEAARTCRTSRSSRRCSTTSGAS